MIGDGEGDGPLARVERRYAGYVFDLDGTLYLGDALLPGARDAVLALRAAGSRTVFLTNKPLERPADYAAKLSRLGIPAISADVVSSTDALLRYLGLHASGARLYPVAEPLLWDLLEEAGWELTDDPARIDVVVVSFDRTFAYSKLQIAFDAVRAGARIVATNPDAWCPVPGGGLPDCAAMLAAIEACTGARAEAIVGKPSAHMAATLLDRLALVADHTLLVGDRLATDMRMAIEAGMAAALVLSGATTLADVAAGPVRPRYVLAGVADVVPIDLARAAAQPAGLPLAPRPPVPDP
ncbi:MAG TPA: HAD-IIA family hydrolase [Candidatus Limnocylindrales bacterium]|nr:HAD-IIA family hydrolase [Candidatus Limnocylindrales bacterium]